MSNAEQAVSGIIGGVVGFALSGGSPVGFLYGFQTGLLAAPNIVPARSEQP